MKSATKPGTFQPAPTQPLRRWLPCFFFMVGFLALGYVAFTLLDARLYQVNEDRRFEQVRQERQAQKSALSSSVSGKVAPSLVPARLGAAIEGPEIVSDIPVWGRIRISSIGLSAMILEGVDQKTLQRAVGHFPGTALPGQPGNVVLTGHRDTFFRALRNISEGDEIVLETFDGAYRYRVDLTQVVDPGHTEVLNGSDDAILTLVTCYPFVFVGPAPQRYIVRAHRILD